MERTTVKKEEEMTPEIKTCKEEKYDSYNWENFTAIHPFGNQTFHYYPTYETGSSEFSIAESSPHYTFNEQKPLTKPRMSFSISSILGTEENKDERQPSRSSTFTDSLFMTHTPQAMMKTSKMKRRYLHEEMMERKEECTNKTGNCLIIKNFESSKILH